MNEFTTVSVGPSTAPLAHQWRRSIVRRIVARTLLPLAFVTLLVLSSVLFVPRPARADNTFDAYIVLYDTTNNTFTGITGNLDWVAAISGPGRMGPTGCRGRRLRHSRDGTAAARCLSVARGRTLWAISSKPIADGSWFHRPTVRTIRTRGAWDALSGTS